MEIEKRTVVVIPKIEKQPIDEATGIMKKKRVCAYARVSTDLEDQKNSFRAQEDEFTTRILKNPDWEFVKMYSDEGLSGTSIKRRKGFNDMINDAMAGKIDLILTKSISRFARNTVDFLRIVRQLREKGVEIYFEKEAISSLDDRCEMMLTMYASFAQEESHSISENVKWGVRKRMAKGTRKLNANHLLGYEIDEDGKLRINEPEAEAVRKIYDLYIMGRSYREICASMEKNGYLTQTGKDKWTVNNIHSILSNEKYCGDILQQKTFVRDFLSHEAVKNNGEVQQYLIVKNHKGIVSKETFVYVQNLKKYRNENFDNRTTRINVGPLANLIYCADCGRVMKKITSHPGTAYAKTVLTCKAELKTKEGHKECLMKNTIPYDLTVDAIKEIIEGFTSPKDMELLCDSVMMAKSQSEFLKKEDEITRKINELEKEVRDLIKKQIEENMDISAYADEYKAKQAEINSLKESLSKIDVDEFTRNERAIVSRRIKEFSLKNEALSPKIASQFIFKGIRRADNSVRFILRSQSTTEEWLEGNREKIMGMKPWKKGKVSKGGDALSYDVVKMEDFVC